MTAHRTRSLDEAKAARAELQRYFAEMDRKGWTTLEIATGIDIADDGSYAVRVNVQKLGAGASQIPKSVNGIAVVVRETGVVRARPVQPLVNCEARGEAWLGGVIESLSRQFAGKAGIVSISDALDANGALVLEAYSTEPHYAESLLPKQWQGLPVVVRESGDVIPYDNYDDEVEYDG
jgi:hypothetical protein